MENNLNRDLEEALKFFENIDATTIVFDCCKMVDKGSMWDLRKHAHQVIEIIYMIDAKAHINIQEKMIYSTWCDVVVYPPHHLHQEYIDINRTQKCIYIRFDVKSSINLEKPFQIKDSEGKIQWLLEQIASLSKETENDLNQRLINIYIEGVLLSLAKNIKQLSLVNPEVVDLAMRYMHYNYQEDITITKLATMFYVSPSYLSRLFQRKVHISPMNYLNNVRIEVAKKLLCNGTETINTIATAVGISDAKYFSRIFKKYVGKSPTQFRKSHQMLN